MDATPQAERWLALAKQALSFRRPQATVTWLAHTHNAVFLMEDAGQKYVMRLSHPETSSHFHAETKWLAAIQKHTALIVPDLVGYFISPREVVAAHWKYIEGKSRDAADITPDNMRQIGEFLATMHSVPLTFINHHVRSHYNRLDYDGLYGPNSRYAPGEAAALFTDEQKQTMAEAQARVKAAMDKLGTNRKYFGLIHGDTLLSNILFDGDDVRLLDFEYCGYGYYLYDLAPLLWELKPQPTYQVLEDALWQGYTAIRPLPPRDLLETFIAARHIATMLWVTINHDHPFIAGRALAILEQSHQELRGFLETGRLRRLSDW